MYQLKSAELAPLQMLRASKRRTSLARCCPTRHEWEREAKLWHPRAGAEELRGKPFRQALARPKPVV